MTCENRDGRNEASIVIRSPDTLLNLAYVRRSCNDKRHPYLNPHMVNARER